MTDEDFKRTLWEAANGLRGAVSAAEYKYPVLGLVFLKYVSDMFDAQAEVIRQRLADPNNADLYIEDEEIRAESEEIFIEDRTFYETDNVFWIPEDAKFKTILEQATSADLAQRLDRAMALIEAENSQLKGVLYREFSRLALEPGKLGDLVNTIARMRFNPKDHGSRDIFGEVYEYFLGQFAKSEGQRAGEFYTPKSVVNLLVETLAPFKGKIYDPACGSGGMFVQSMKFKDAHQKTLGKTGDLAVYGQELMAHTRKLCLMNLAVHGLEGDLGKSYGSTFTSDQHKSLRADYILANPPFNISNWDGDKLTEDPRWSFGIPPSGNANYAWLQHMWSRLSTKGRAGIVLANGSMTSNTSNEGVIRQSMIKGDAVECMISLPGQLFSNTQIPACLWFLSRDKAKGINGSVDRKNQILFIDARKLASNRVSRTQVEFSDEDLQKISQIYHRWRGTEFSDNEIYSDVQGICYSASYDVVEAHNFNLSPGRYVGAAEYEDDVSEFQEEMENLIDSLSFQMNKSNELDKLIVASMKEVGYEV